MIRTMSKCKWDRFSRTDCNVHLESHGNTFFWSRYTVRTAQSIHLFGTQSKNEVGQRKVIKHYGQGIYESTFEFYELCLNDQTF